MNEAEWVYLCSRAATETSNESTREWALHSWRQTSKSSSVGFSVTQAQRLSDKASQQSRQLPESLLGAASVQMQNTRAD